MIGLITLIFVISKLLIKWKTAYKTVYN
jgi:hypothetical protein